MKLIVLLVFSFVVNSRAFSQSDSYSDSLKKQFAIRFKILDKAAPEKAKLIPFIVVRYLPTLWKGKHILKPEQWEIC